MTCIRWQLLSGKTDLTPGMTGSKSWVLVFYTTLSLLNLKAKKQVVQLIGRRKRYPGPLKL